MKPFATTLSLALVLTACGSPKDEDKLTPEAIEASQSAPEKPDVELSANPEPEPAPPAATAAANEMEDGMNESEGNGADMEPLPATGVIPAAFRGRWGMTVEDCMDPRRPGSTALSVGSDTLELPDAAGRLVRTEGDYPERFIGQFAFNGDQGRWISHEELSLTGSSNVLVRDADGERLRYRRCVRPKV
jgi:hypothetical protein